MSDLASANGQGGSTWLAARSGERATAALVANDPRFKKYSQQVEKCLTSFDNVHEWADFITFLTKLLKTFQSYLQFKEIPRKLIVSKRLAQCLNPALPTGVHQKALEVYAHILAVLGTEGLKRDLQLWSYGLFPFFEYASTAVKPTLINLYDTYYLPLKQGLRPVMKSFILALLPGLEETTGEFFDKVMHLIERLSSTVSLSFFLQNVWLVVLTTPSARGSAINYLSRKLPSLDNQTDVTQIVGRDVGLMIRAFSAALEDDNLFVQRAILDLLLQSLRIDSDVVKRAQATDKALLMKSAAGVVLRRDSSLNRRLHTWLVGQDENSQAQEAYFKAHSLDMLASTLRVDMFADTLPTTADARPFKIFLSLLDKAEIGSPLTDLLILDALRAIKLTLRSDEEGGADIQIAANALYNFVELHTVWKHLFSTVRAELLGEGKTTEGTQLMQFVVETFKAHDEEVQHIHLPLVFGAISEIIRDFVARDAANLGHPFVEAALHLLRSMLPFIAPSALTRMPEIRDGSNNESAPPSGLLSLACHFYGIEHTPTSSKPTLSPFAAVYQDLVFLTDSHCQHNQSGAPSHIQSAVQETFFLSMSLISELAATLPQKETATPVQIDWQPKKWWSSVLSNLDQMAAFVVLDKIVNVGLALSKLTTIEPRLSIDDRPTLSTLVTRLFWFLQPHYAPYHVRAVQHLWSLERDTSRSHVESIIAGILASPPKGKDAFDAFGVFWRLSDDTDLPGFRFKIPMFIVLDSLKSEDPHLRRMGETWMRCSLKSYLRVLDPLLYDLLDSSIKRTPAQINIDDRDITGLEYERPFDQTQTIYLLETLVSVIRFGGLGFSKVARTNLIKRSQFTNLGDRVTAAKFIYVDPSYTEVFVEIMLRNLQSEPRQALKPTMGNHNTRIQAVSIDILQATVARGDMEARALDVVANTIISKLFVATHTQRLDLQSKLLHLLYTVLITSAADPRQSKGERTVSDTGIPDDGNEYKKQTPAPVNPLLLPTLIDGLSRISNRPLLQHWLDFVLMTVPQLQRSLSPLIFPLCDCICLQLRQSLTDLDRVSNHALTSKIDVTSEITDAEFMMLLNALERLVLSSLTKSGDGGPPDEDGPYPERAGESGGLLGYVSNVFSSDNTEGSVQEALSPRSPTYRCLHEAVIILNALWIASAWTPPKDMGPQSASLGLVYSRIRLRCRRVLERLFRAQSGEVMESIIECWFWASTQRIGGRSNGTFEIVDLLAASAQTVVHMLCESIAIRMSPFPEKTKRLALNPNLTDAILFTFLEEYLSRLEGPIAIQVWPRCMTLAKDVTGNIYGYKLQLFPVLRCVTVLADIVARTTALEDRRMRRELQEIFTKLADTCILIAGRSFDQGNWIRRGPKETLAVNSSVNGRNSPLPTDEKVTATEDLARQAWGPDLIDQINVFLATKVVPNLRKFLVDADKVVSISTNIVYYVVNPSMKAKSGRTLEVEDIVLDIIREMIKIPATAKAWKGPVSEAFIDARFFNASPEANFKWRPLIRGLMDSDKLIFADLIGKVASAPSANIFTNREYEMIMRSLNLRRLSYVLFSGDKNHFLAQLPSIQEKLVEILRNVTSPVIQSEVYLCLRVLLCRLSPHNLSSFWPVILTELVRVFEQVMIEPPADGSEDLQLVLAACKFLDLVLVLQTQEFQIHQWMFVTDTVDAIYRPEDWHAESIMDQLAEIVRELPDSKTSDGISELLSDQSSMARHDGGRLRRPLLSSVREIKSIKDLMPFFSHVSIVSYESVYAVGSIDWEAVETGLCGEMFEGTSDT